MCTCMYTYEINVSFLRYPGTVHMMKLRNSYANIGAYVVDVLILLVRFLDRDLDLFILYVTVPCPAREKTTPEKKAKNKESTKKPGKRHQK